VLPARELRLAHLAAEVAADEVEEGLVALARITAAEVILPQ
jgi:hypothetical protein